MPAATPLRVRREIVQRRDSGESYASIARGLNMPYITVWKVDQHYRQRGHLEADYAACRQTAVRKSAAVYEQAVQLKRDHPGWGAGLIWVELAEVWAENDLPSVRTLQRWFHRGGVARRPPERVAAVSVRRGKRPHEVWALDAKEGIQLADGTYVSWLTISDEASGAVLASTLFPPATLEQHRPPLGETGGAACHATLGKATPDADG